ncbi:leucine-rich melanocyte differentiation-associated protein [Galendromus occidentalis]|uniref:Leucine-rich melanocyte differentiation-associated protein n=1 Tax=Galendromus occidentalis TaxID=34638 RepID=A0AAJ6QYN3_9ACAR|nr:leucine-rich melanocyte differentiation-associated protein [Galendromus occidentalis]
MYYTKAPPGQSSEPDIRIGFLTGEREMNTENGRQTGHSSVNSGVEVLYVDKEAQRIPDWILNKYALTAETVDISWNCLKTLNGIDSLTRLRHLILDNNDLKDPDIFDSVFCGSLQTLSLNKNQFPDITKLMSAINQAFPRLRHLSLLGNPCCPDRLTRPQEQDQEDYTGYRLYVISQLSFLDFLDSSEISPQERNRARQIGRFQVVAKPRLGPYRSPNEDELPSGLHPLPAGTREGQGRPAYGTRKYRYLGNHSEGNRFIKDTQL